MGALLGAERSPLWPVPPLRVAAGRLYAAGVLAPDGAGVSWNPNSSAPNPCPCYTLRSVLVWLPALSGSANPNGAACVIGSASGPGNGLPSLSVLIDLEGELSQTGISGRRATAFASTNASELAKSG